MQIDMNQVEYVHLKGLEIPDELAQLTAGAGGLMMYWMHDDRKNMVAIAIKHQGQFIGWSAFLREEEEGIYSLGTFIASEYRGLGFAKMAVTLLVECIQSENTLAYCKFGGSLFAEFDVTYSRIVRSAGLKTANIFEHNSRIKAA
jgi:Acetyltransferase (GNAT) domain